MTSSAERRTALLRRAFAVTGTDVVAALRHLWVNIIGGSFLLPRVLRVLVYRSAGLNIRTANILDGARIRGRGGLAIGAGTFVSRECYFEAAGPISIGRDCHLAMQVMVVTSTHALEPDGGVATTPTILPVQIGDRCWLGARCTVLPGVTIGDGAVVAAGAVVTSDCEPRGLYAGVPAVRKRDLGPR